MARQDGGSDSLPSIRFSAFYDSRATRPSLKFAPVSRTLPTGREVIRVGRYSRLSPPGTESKPYPVNDGDIVQLGIDFKGGEEMIFRCVKMRLELNRGWQNKLNNFNMATHKRLRNMVAGNPNSSTGAYSQDCSICLNSVGPCQCLFVAPCSHTWHYKCIRTLLSAPSYPIFICPNCRAAADLEAEVEDPEEWEQLDSDENAAAAAAQQQQQQQQGASLHLPSVDGASAPRRSRESVRSARLAQAQVVQQQASQQIQLQQQQHLQQNPLHHSEIPDVTMIEQFDGPTTTTPLPTTTATLFGLRHTVSDPFPSPTLPHSASWLASAAGHLRPTAGVGVGMGMAIGGGGVGGLHNQHEGPITPRNDAGPWVFDGTGMGRG
ncbi:hypothetical protein N0V88_001872 [Collariella sp. IMI 366227]|nr:hypothetical protein N0V88_001872 [Collariella sp. IMI 366227]